MMDSLSVATTVFDLAGRPRRLGGALGDALAVSSGESSGVSGKAFRHAGIWADTLQTAEKLVQRYFIEELTLNLSV